MISFSVFAKFGDSLNITIQKLRAVNLNGDNELKKIIEESKHTTKTEDFSELLSNWITSLGEVKNCRLCSEGTNETYFNKNLNLDWIQDSTLFKGQLISQLRYIETNRFQGKHYYVSENKGIGNIEVTNETTLNKASLNNNFSRLLLLFRYWNVIEYFFPYKYQIDEDWDVVLSKYIDVFSKAETELTFHLSFLKLVVELDDSHANFFTEPILTFFGKKYIPAYYSLREKKAIITGFFNDSLAKVNDIRKGDIILKVDGEKIADILEQREGLIHGSNWGQKLYNFRYAVFNGNSDSILVELIRNNKKISKKIGRYFFNTFGYTVPDLSKWEILEGNIGLVNTWLLNLNDVQDMMEDLKTTKAIILDLRRYPKNVFHHLLIKYFKSEKSTFYKAIVPDISYPGRFKYVQTPQSGGKELKFRRKIIEKYTGKIVLLVNSYTISHGEFMAMELQTADNVITVGTQSAGTDGNVSTFEVIEGYKTRFTGVGIFYPDGTETQKKGVRIDIPVIPTLEGAVEGKDEILETALKEITKI